MMRSPHEELFDEAFSAQCEYLSISIRILTDLDQLNSSSWSCACQCMTSGVRQETMTSNQCPILRYAELYDANLIVR